LSQITIPSLALWIFKFPWISVLSAVKVIFPYSISIPVADNCPSILVLTWALILSGNCYIDDCVTYVLLASVLDTYSAVTVLNILPGNCCIWDSNWDLVVFAPSIV